DRRDRAPSSRRRCVLRQRVRWRRDWFLSAQSLDWIRIHPSLSLRSGRVACPAAETIQTERGQATLPNLRGYRDLRLGIDGHVSMPTNYDRGQSSSPLWIFEKEE